MTRYAVGTADDFMWEEIFDTIEEAQGQLERFYIDSPEDLEGCIIYEVKPVLRVALPPMKPIYEEI